MRLASKLGLTFAAALTCGVACSLGLDPSKINGTDGGSDAALDVVIDAPNPVACKGDPDCKPTNGCLTGKCITGQCTYTLCPANACNASICDPMAHTCSAPSAYSFHAGTFHVAQGNIGCNSPPTSIGGQARRCFAAVYPFVFVGTTNGVVAYSVANPAETSASAIPVAGLPFFPNLILSNGATVYFIGQVVGTGPDYDVPIATLTVPTDPTVTEMSATTVFDTLPFPSIDFVFPDAMGGIYLVRDDPSKSFPVARIAAPLSDLATLSFSPTPGIPTTPTPEGLVAASGTRLVSFGQDNGGAFGAWFSLETGAATPSAQNAGAQSVLSSVGQTYAVSYFATGPAGGLLWSTDAVNVPDGGPLTYTGARVSWVLQDGMATSFDATTHVDMSTYSTMATSNLAGPVAWVDSNTAIAVSANPMMISQGLVQVASRSGTPTVVPMRSFGLAFDPSSVAVVASSHFGYVLTPDSSQGANVHVFDTGCNN